WAPPIENNTESYIQATARLMGVKPEEPINVRNSRVMAELVKAIITHENGQQPYADEVIEEGVRRALGTPAPEPRPVPIVTGDGDMAVGSVTPDAPVPAPKSAVIPVPVPEGVSPPPGVPQTNHKAWWGAGIGGGLYVVVEAILQAIPPGIIPSPWDSVLRVAIPMLGTFVAVEQKANRPKVDPAMIAAIVAALPKRS
ncbi:MAG TPA: hypothetical protein VD768_06120, partial [Sphingomicrobium sp.]|nr:hypothetical protein [Sphingomicrobium sp.]